MRRLRCVVQQVIERQRAMPCQRLPDPPHGLANLGAIDADLEHVAATWPFHNLTIDMAGDEASAIKRRLRALKCPGHGGLDQQAVSERILPFELKQQRVALVRVADPPDAGARGAESSLDKKRVG